VQGVFGKESTALSGILTLPRVTLFIPLNSHAAAAAAFRTCALVFLLLVVLTSSLTYGGIPEGSLSGVVTDSATGRPLESTNVFLSNTLRGAVTDKNGRYILTAVQPGVYQLVASHVGYEHVAVRIEIAGGDSVVCNFELAPRAVRAQEVEVVAEAPVRWRRDLSEFRREFIGSGEFAGDCGLLNPEVLSFRWDDATGIFHASTDSTLRVKNNALGYVLSVTLDSFTWDPGTEAVGFKIYVHFEALLPQKEGDSARWARNRKIAYRGSERHFLRALVKGTLNSEGFFVSDAQGVSFGSKAHKVLLIQPDGIRLLAYDSILRIDFGGETRLRRNYVKLAQGLVHIRPDGSLVEQEEFLIDPSSDWARHRVARMLPLEFQSE